MVFSVVLIDRNAVMMGCTLIGLFELNVSDVIDVLSVTVIGSCKVQTLAN